MALKLFPYGVREPSEIPDIADNILDEYFAVIKELKLKACLAYGLCLGFVRDGGYIPGDNDLDVVAITPTNSLTPDLSEALVKRGFKRGEIFPLPTNNVHFHKDNILLDIFFRKPELFYINFDKVMYKNKTYTIPYPVEEYLNTCYTNWEIKSNQAGKHGV